VFAARTFNPRPIGGDPEGVGTAVTEVGVTVGVAVIGGDSPSIETGLLKLDSCMEVRYRCVLEPDPKEPIVAGGSGVARGCDRLGIGCRGALNADGGARADVDAFRGRSEAGERRPVGEEPPCGVAGTDKVDRTAAVLVDSRATVDAGRAVWIPDCNWTLLISLGGSMRPASGLPEDPVLGVGTDPEAEVELLEVVPAMFDMGELALIRSAAILTLVGTLFRRIAPLPIDEVDADDDNTGWCGLGGLNGDESESAVHGEGSGFRGEIMDADVDREGTCVPLSEARGPPMIGILRESPLGLRNSLGLRCLGGLYVGDKAYHDDVCSSG